MSYLARLSLDALKWNTFGVTVGLLLQFAVGVILARILGPEPFGLMAVGWLVLGLGNLLAEGGMGAALIQRREITDDDIRGVFSVQLMTGVALAVVTASASGLLAAFFRKPEAAAVVAAMAFILVVQPFGQTASSLLRRELRFKEMQGARLVSYVAGYVGVGLPLALSAHGVWSLVAAQVVQTVAYVTVVYASAHHSIWPLVSPTRVRVLRFGAVVTGSNLSSWAIGSMDSAIVARFFGTLDLGVYNRVFNLLNLPLNTLVSSVQGVLFSAGSRLQDDPVRLRHAFLASLGAVGLVALPPFVATAAVPEIVLLGLYGEQWRAGVVVLVPLALAMPFYALLAMCGPLLTAVGRARSELSVQSVLLALMFVAYPLAARVGLVTLVWTVVGAYVLRFALLLAVTLRALGARLGDVVGVLLVPLGIALLLGLVARAVGLAMDEWSIGYEVKLALTLLVLGCLYLLCIHMLRHWLIRGSVHEVLLVLAPELPAGVARWAGLRTQGCASGAE